MTDRYFTKSGCIKSLVTLCLAMQFSACSEESVVSTVVPDVVVDPTTLAWAKPEFREDDTAISLTEIGGYRVYYGSTSGDYQEQVNITSDGASLAVDDLNLTAGATYYLLLPLTIPMVVKACIRQRLHSVFNSW